MFITTYKVTSPGVLEEFVEAFDTEKNIIVKVDTMAICKADIRYFLGTRDKSVLEHKYPLCPIHEATGIVVKDPSNKFKSGDKVVLVPNSINANNCINCEHIRCSNKDMGNNYCPYASFKSSTTDGFLRPFVTVKEDGIIKYDSNIDSSIAVFSELLSVSYAASRRINFDETNNIALFGDGLMAYMVYLVLYYKFHKQITVFGVDDNKMAKFKYAKTCHIEKYVGKKFDTLIEAIGGKYSADGINSMIEVSTIGADLILMGVSEEKVQINTRRILDKGLVLKGVTRSTSRDFKQVVKLIEDTDIKNDLKDLVISTIKINSINDIYKAYELDINNRTIIGKNIMKW